MNDQALLSVEGLVRRFTIDDRDITVLDGVDLTLNRGEMVGIIGSSGAGKSTFLHILGALDKPTSGRVLYNGTDIFGLDEEKLANFRSKRIGFVFQASHLLPEFSAEENVALAAMIFGHSKTEALKKSREMLIMVGLGQRLTHRPGKLSGGEAQRVAIARALVNQPDLILADEPTGNLDSGSGSDVFELILKMNREHEQSFIIVTHNIDLARRLPRVARIKDGKFVYSAGDMLE